MANCKGGLVGGEEGGDYRCLKAPLTCGKKRRDHKQEEGWDRVFAPPKALTVTGLVYRVASRISLPSWFNRLVGI